MYIFFFSIVRQKATNFLKTLVKHFVSRNKKYSTLLTLTLDPSYVYNKALKSNN